MREYYKLSLSICNVCRFCCSCSLLGTCILFTTLYIQSLSTNNPLSSRLINSRNTLFVITHANQDDETSLFWNKWDNGAKIAAQIANYDLRILRTSYDSAMQVKYMKQFCKNGSKLAITIPYDPSTEEHATIHNAVNDCIDKGSIVITTNTDTYTNTRVYQYVGSNNFLIGKNCARYIMGTKSNLSIGNRYYGRHNYYSDL